MIASPVIPARASWHDPHDHVHPYLVLDVFTRTPLEGNQLGVFEDGRPFSSAQMQALAREMNFAETVFLLPPEDGGDVRLRIFTPSKEMPFAGHPVLGSSFVVAEALGKDIVRLETPAQSVTVELEREGASVAFGRMRQPVPSPEPFARAPELLRALGVECSELPIVAYDNGPRHVYVMLAGEASVAALDPDLNALRSFDYSVNCFARAGARWKTRMFAPAWGIPEDPATGSAAGPLAVHLAQHGLIALGVEIEIQQGAEIRRPSTIFARVSGPADDRIDSVEVGGSAVVVSRGDYLIDRTGLDRNR